ncbi:MAG TPA: hypothetical protein PKC21_07475 [Oligoflexia bacterium]|nr:hypothetical protein [Oligoflexia bacterium]HMR25176.1 hypothetical protein [Oligoflexia bacterium]
MANKVTSIRKALDILNEAKEEKKDEIQKMISQEYKEIKSVVDEIKPKVQYKAAQIQDDMMQAVNHVNKKVTDLKNEVDQKTKENPWKAVGIASAAAFVVGMLVTRGK